MKTSILIILLTSFLLSACGGGSAGKAPDAPITDDTGGSETQSANGIWGADIITAEGIDTQLFGIFNEGEFALALLMIAEVPVSETETFESISGNIIAGTYSIQGDQLDTDSVKLYALNDDFIENGSGTAVVTSASTMMLTAKDGAGATSLEADLLYDDVNDLEVSIDALAGTWEILDSTCFGSVNFNSCSLSINGTGNISLGTTECQLEGTISQTATNNVMALATSITGDNCASAGQYTGFTAYGGSDIDDDGESYEEIIMLMSNEQSAFGYTMQKQQMP